MKIINHNKLCVFGSVLRSGGFLMKKFCIFILTILTLITFDHFSNRDLRLAEKLDNFLNNDYSNSIPQYNAVFHENDWISNNVPELHSDEWYKSNHSSESWVIYKDKDVLKIRNDHKYNIITTYDVGDGYFRGTNRGEYGGNLEYVSKNILKRSYEILDGNVVSIFNYNDGIYVLEGLTHMGINEGRIYQLNKDYRRWSAKEMFNLNDSPQVYTITEDNELLIVTFSGLFKISDMKNIEHITKDAFWQSLIPTSIVVDEKIVYIGMRGGIAKVNLDNKDILWLAKKE